MTTSRSSRAGRLGGLALCTIAAASPAATASAAPAEPPHTPAQLVVKINVADGCSVTGLNPKYPIVVDDSVLASRGIYLVHGADAAYQADAKKAKKLADKLAKDTCVAYAEVDQQVHLTDTRFHSWTPDGPGTADASAWAAQALTARLGLDDVHRQSSGAHVRVAVLDTGVDATQPVLAGTLLPGWDYVDDDPQPEDEAAGVDSDLDGTKDSAVGHGTFVSGLVTLVSPAAQVIPLRVLDSDGTGNAFVIAQAILDAQQDGATVINLSFGTAAKVESSLVKDAIKDVRSRGVVVVAAAGNDGSSTPHFPASMPEVVGVAALDEGDELASFSDRGSWVDVAAPGLDLVGPLPGGRFGTWSGTSLAAPVVSGQVALMTSLRPDLKPKELTETIGKTARKARDKSTRHGAVDLLKSVSAILARK